MKKDAFDNVQGEETCNGICEIFLSIIYINIHDIKIWWTVFSLRSLRPGIFILYTISFPWQPGHYSEKLRRFGNKYFNHCFQKEHLTPGCLQKSFLDYYKAVRNQLSIVVNPHRESLRFQLQSTGNSLPLNQSKSTVGLRGFVGNGHQDLIFVYLCGCCGAVIFNVKIGIHVTNISLIMH